MSARILPSLTLASNVFTRPRFKMTHSPFAYSITLVGLCQQQLRPMGEFLYHIDVAFNGRGRPGP